MFALFDISFSPLLLEDVEEFGILVFTRDDNNIVEIFSGSANQANTADINLFDNFLCATSVLHCLLEGVEVNNDEVDLRYGILYHLGLVFCQATTAQDSTKHFGV